MYLHFCFSWKSIITLLKRKYAFPEIQKIYGFKHEGYFWKLLNAKEREKKDKRLNTLSLDLSESKRRNLNNFTIQTFPQRTY